MLRAVEWSRSQWRAKTVAGQLIYIGDARTVSVEGECSVSQEHGRADEYVEEIAPISALDSLLAASGRFECVPGALSCSWVWTVHIAVQNHLSGVCVDQRAEDPFRVLGESVEHVQPPLAAEYRVFPCAIVLGRKFVEGVGTEPE